MGDLSRNFSRMEFQSKDGAPGYNTVDARLLDVLEAIRKDFGGKPVRILSGHRSPSHNRKVGGATNSQHLYGRAADFIIIGVKPSEVTAHVRKNYQDISVGGYGDRFTHIDTRAGRPAHWGTR